MKNILILASQNINYFPVLDWIKNTNYNFYIFVKEEHKNDYLKYGSDFNNIKIFHFKNWNKNWNIENKIIELNKIYTIHKLISVTEEDTIRAALLRDMLRIEGQNIESAIFFRNKDKMKEHVSEMGFKVPEFKVIKNFSDYYEFKNKIKFPIIIKPIDGAGSQNTFIIENKEDEIKFLSKIPKNIFLAEQYINGDIFHIDGLLFEEDLKFISSSKYHNNSLSFNYGKSPSSYFLKRNSEIHQKLEKYTKKLLNNLPNPQNMVFHLEVFIDEFDDIIFCEIASRTSGGQVSNNIIKEYNLNLTKEYILKELNISSSFTFKNKIKEWSKYRGFVMSIPLKGKLKSYPKSIPFDWVSEVNYFGQLDKEYNGATNSVQCIAAISCEATTEESMKERLDFIDSWFKKHCYYI